MSEHDEAIAAAARAMTGAPFPTKASLRKARKCVIAFLTAWAPTDAAHKTAERAVSMKLDRTGIWFAAETTANELKQP